MSYRDLEVWQMSRTLVVDIHRLTMEGLPSFEMYEEGSQIRRSMKFVKSNCIAPSQIGMHGRHVVASGSP